MTQRALLVGLVTVAVGAWAAGPLAAEDKAGTQDGTVVRVEEGKLTMTDKNGKDERTHAVGRDARISCDGKECKLADLMKGYMVKVTTEKKGEETVVTRIEAKKDA